MQQLHTIVEKTVRCSTPEQTEQGKRKHETKLIFNTTVKNPKY